MVIVQWHSICHLKKKLLLNHVYCVNCRNALWTRTLYSPSWQEAQSKFRPVANWLHLTLECYRGSARPRSNEVMHVKLRKQKLRALNSSVASCFCVTSNRCDCSHPRSSRFCKGASSSRVRVWQIRW